MGVLDGKVAIVTGAGRGIGREIALDFARNGARVLVNDLGGAADGTGASLVAEEVAQEIRSAGGEAASSGDSVATVEGGKRIFQSALDAFGIADILVNNAGILRDRTLFNMEEDDWDAVIEVHLKGHYCCSRPFARYIRETDRRECRILNFSSVSGLFGNFGQSNYGAAKAGIAGFSRVLALELGKYACTVNTISPGAATRLTIPLREGRGDAVDPENPLVGPQQIAPVCTWLASPAAQQVNAQVINVMRGTVGIMQQPAVIRSFETDHLWTQDDLDRVMPALLEAKQAHDERARCEGEPESLEGLES
ncbi:MAG: SDR family NAD(P)-dependent oxidoreductase [Deltaproteobacteria bacterium]|nr:SDR family NAD(P)-dependent oxidoreductase [Deltaproteobacteria bacterium]